MTDAKLYMRGAPALGRQFYTYEAQYWPLPQGWKVALPDSRSSNPDSYIVVDAEGTKQFATSDAALMLDIVPVLRKLLS